MPTKAQIERNTIVRIAAYDNDEKPLEEILANHNLKIYDDLGLGDERRIRCAKFLNEYIIESIGTPVKNEELVKKGDTVGDVIDKVFKAIH